ncbi:MAG: hypothetical protein FJY10_06695 [Bacteroidetes bacterium]|nr:hypothetical protein [Bacteroidota bacterium]
MKKKLLFLPVILLLAIFVLIQCKKDDPEPECGNIGSICFQNKLDVPVTINMMQIPYIFTLQPDFMECIDLEADIAYNYRITAQGYQKDSTLLILPCDQTLILIQN